MSKDNSCWLPKQPNKEFCGTLIGLEREEAISAIEKKHLRARLTRIDGKSFIVTMDMRLDRVNLELEQGKVIKATIG